MRCIQQIATSKDREGLKVRQQKGVWRTSVSKLSRGSLSAIHVCPRDSSCNQGVSAFHARVFFYFIFLLEELLKSVNANDAKGVNAMMKRV